MRPIVVRALTAALATGGAVWAIVLPTLTLGEARSPSHAFAIPASGGDLVIEASRLGTPTIAHRARIASSRATTRHAPTRAIIAVATPPRGTAPISSPRRAATPRRIVPEVVPKPLPAPTPAPQPQAQAHPATEPTVRTLASVVVTKQPTPPAENESEQEKQHQDKPHKQKKPKHDKVRKDDAQSPAAPAAAAPSEQVVPVEPVAVDKTEQNEPAQNVAGEDNDDKEHGGHGKGHDKKK